MTPRDPIHVIRPLPTAPVVAILMGFWTLWCWLPSQFCSGGCHDRDL